MTTKVIRYHYRGLIERGGGFPLRYRWTNGYSEGEKGVVTYPWMTRRECQVDAKVRGAKAIFVQEGST